MRIAPGQVDAAADRFGELVRGRRAAAGLTQEELAQLSGLGVRTISDIERGRIGRPHRRSLDLLCDALGLVAPGRDARATGSGWTPALADLDGRAGNTSLMSVVPRQLPTAIRRLAGRADEQRTLDSLLDRFDGAAGTALILAISGTAGVGKTALAVHWAQRAAERFPDGQLYVNLRGFDPSGAPVAPAEAIGGFLDAFGVPPDRIPVSADAQGALYRSLLSGRRMLIILDNARDDAQVRPLLPGSTPCLVLVTSRRQLAGLAATEAAHLLTLDTLTRAEARELLSDRLGHELVDDETGAVGELISLCAGLPLALAIAAARHAARPSHPLQALVEELRPEQDRLKGLNATDVADAVTSARAVFSWSYQSLSHHAARMFRLLAAHPGPSITATAAAGLAGVGLDRTRTLLRELVLANLLTEHADSSYTLNDLLRAYAAEQAGNTGESGRGPAMRRMLDHTCSPVRP
jgi:transcriptional regulator with XRE-family HTH domain